MEVIVISNPSRVEGEDEILDDLFSSGLMTYHLRRPGETEDEVERSLQCIAPSYRNRVVLHSHHRLASRYGVRGIHLPEKMRKGNAHSLECSLWMKIQNPALHVSTSYHALTDLWEYRTNGRREYGYVFLSPLFDSISKPGYRSAFDIDEVRKVLLSISQKVVALGGVTPKNTSLLKESGFFGVALLGAVWQSDHPEEVFLEMMERCAA